MNEYGLDVNYLSEKLSLLLRDISRYTPSEMSRALVRLSIVADEKVMKEKEFSKAHDAIEANAELIQSLRDMVEIVGANFCSNQDVKRKYKIARELLEQNK